MNIITLQRSGSKDNLAVRAPATLCLMGLGCFFEFTVASLPEDTRRNEEVLSMQPQIPTVPVGPLLPGVVNARRELNQLRSRVPLLEQRIHELESLLAGAGQTDTDLQRQIAEHDATIASLRTELVASAARVDELTRQVAQLSEQLSALRSSYAELAQDSERQEQQYREDTQRRQEQTARMIAAERELHRNQMLELNEQIEPLEAQIVALRAEVDRLNTLIAGADKEKAKRDRVIGALLSERQRSYERPPKPQQESQQGSWEQSLLQDIVSFREEVSPSKNSSIEEAASSSTTEVEIRLEEPARSNAARRKKSAISADTPTRTKKTPKKGVEFPNFPESTPPTKGVVSPTTFQNKKNKQAVPSPLVSSQNKQTRRSRASIEIVENKSSTDEKSEKIPAGVLQKAEEVHVSNSSVSLSNSGSSKPKPAIRGRTRDLSNRPRWNSSSATPAAERCDVGEGRSEVTPPTKLQKETPKRGEKMEDNGLSRRTFNASKKLITATSSSNTRLQRPDEGPVSPRSRGKPLAAGEEVRSMFDDSPTKLSVAGSSRSVGRNNSRGNGADDSVSRSSVATRATARKNEDTGNSKRWTAMLAAATAKKPRMPKLLEVRSRSVNNRPNQESSRADNRKQLDQRDGFWRPRSSNNQRVNADDAYAYNEANKQDYQARQSYIVPALKKLERTRRAQSVKNRKAKL